MKGFVQLDSDMKPRTTSVSRKKKWVAANAIYGKADMLKIPLLDKDGKNVYWNGEDGTAKSMVKFVNLDSAQQLRIVASKVSTGARMSKPSEVKGESTTWCERCRCEVPSQVICG